MNSFKDIAYQILKETGKLLHSKEITKIALEKGWLITAGKTPEATMNTQLVVDINSKKDKSRFIKTAPSVFGLNESFAAPEKIEIPKPDKVWKISNDVSSRQKGDIAEAGNPYGLEEGEVAGVYVKEAILRVYRRIFR